jgi:hypothetical protein
MRKHSNRIKQDYYDYDSSFVEDTYQKRSNFYILLNQNCLGPWSEDEDRKVQELVAKYGPSKWTCIASFIPGRVGKQCRERWHNHLNPKIKKAKWSDEDE